MINSPQRLAAEGFPPATATPEAIATFEIYDEFAELHAAIRILNVLLLENPAANGQLAEWQIERVSNLAEGFLRKIEVAA
jgi:hypothetical protein